MNKNFDYLDRVRASIPDRELAIEVFESMHKIFQNIVDNPFDGKFRKLKIGSKFYNNYIDPFKEVKLFLEHASFKSSGEFLVNDASTEDVERTLNDITNYAVALSKTKFSKIKNLKYQISLRSLLSIRINPTQLTLWEAAGIKLISITLLERGVLIKAI